MIPSAKIASCSRAPPENRLISEYSPCWLPVVACFRQKLTWVTLTFGVGMIDPSRKMARIARVKKIFFLRSGVRNALANAASTPASLSSRRPCRDPVRRSGDPYAQDRTTLSRVGEEARILEGPGTGPAVPRLSGSARQGQPGDPVVRRLRLGGTEAGVGQVQVAAVERRGGGDVEARAAREVGLGQGVGLPTTAAAGVEVENDDLVEPVLHRIEGAATDEQTVTVGQQGAPEVDPAGHPRAGVDLEQEAGVGLHHQQGTLVGALRDAVGVVHRRR